MSSNLNIHQYTGRLEWKGNLGSGTKGYKAYSRNHCFTIAGKEDLICSADPAFQGDNTLYNPEELLLASLSSCHMLWFLHLCASNHIVVTAYSDQPIGWMNERKDGSGAFTEVLLRPSLTVSEKNMIEKAIHLHTTAHGKCFISNSVNFPVKHRIHCQAKGQT